MRRLALAVVIVLLVTPHALAYSTVRLDDANQFRFHQHMGAALPLDAVLRDEAGRQVRLGDYFHGAPVILVLDYLRCRTLCGFVLQDVADALSRVPLTAGRDYQVLSISIDPRDGPADARAARAKYISRFGDAASPGWHFLTGTKAASAAVAAAVGFPYRYDAAVDQYVHPAGITVATPAGRVARYILGIGYRPLDLRLALTDAGGEAIATPAAEVLLLCYCYDPGTGRYSFAIQNITRALCGATVIAIGLMVGRFMLARRA